MKKKWFVGILLLLAVPESQAYSHAKHNFVLFGENEIFASHIVYKNPHHYQVILSLRLDEASKAVYLSARREHPSALIRFLLDPMEIQNIAAQEQISGPVLFEDEDGSDHAVISSLNVLRENFSVIYFSELPLSLEAAGHSHEAGREE